MCILYLCFHNLSTGFASVFIIIPFFMKGEQKMYEVFEQLLQKFGVTAYKVGKATNIASSTFTDWKLGRSVPKQDKLQRIADFFGVTITYLMTGNDDEVSESRYEAKNDTERELLVLCRSIEGASEEDKQRLVNNFKSTVDIFLEAKGLK